MITDKIFLKNSSGTSIAIFAPTIDPYIAENANQTDNLLLIPPFIISSI